MDALLTQCREIFANDLYATQTTGITIDSVAFLPEQKDSVVVCSMPLTPRHKNARNAVMGGALFTLADFTFAVASNLETVAKGEELSWVSVDSTIHFLASSLSGTLSATAHCVKQGRTTCLFRIEIQDDKGKLIASIESTGLKVSPTH